MQARTPALPLRLTPCRIQAVNLVTTLRVAFFLKCAIISDGGDKLDTTRSILSQALKMSPTDKFIIIEGLLNSLDEPDKTVDEIWAIEAEKRLQAYKDGKLKTVTYEEVFG